MFTRFVSVARCAILLLLAGEVLAQEQPIVRVQVVGESKFDVLYHRAKSNGTGAAIGGLIGAGIQAGVESGMDQKKRDALRPHVSEEVWQKAFIKTFGDALAEKNYTVIWDNDLANKAGKADIYVQLHPGMHGFKMVDTYTMLVSAFVEFQASYSRKPFAKNGGPKKENFYAAGQKELPYETWAEQASSLNEEIELVFSQAARKLANKIIYNLKQ